MGAQRLGVHAHRKEESFAALCSCSTSFVHSNKHDQENKECFNMANNKLSRRDFLRMSGTAAALVAAGVQLPASLQAAAMRQDPVNVTFAGWGQVAEENGVNAAIEVFEKENPAISVVFQQTPDTNFTQVFLANVAAGTPPDTSF